MRPTLLEALAYLEHQRWAGWMEHMVRSLSWESLARWARQVRQTYDDLPAEDQEKDRAEVRRYLRIMAMYSDHEVLDLVRRHG